MDLKGKTALVTGGSSGIGQAITTSLSKENCKVIFTYSSNEAGAEDTIKQSNGLATKFKIDFKHEAEIQPLFDFVCEKFEKLDILVNNVGVNWPRDLYNTDVWKEVFQVNLFSAVKCIESSVKLMGGAGNILNVTSIYGEGKACWKGLPAYGASKAALNHLTQTLAKNLAPNILVNAVAPGYVKTPFWKNTTEEDFKKSGKEQLIERMIMPQEIADIALAVIKNDAMTGEIVVVDGGISLKTV